MILKSITEKIGYMVCKMRTYARARPPSPCYNLVRRGQTPPPPIAAYVLCTRSLTTIRSTINAKLCQQHRTFWQPHENGLIKTVLTILHNLYMSVMIPLLRIRINQDNSVVRTLMAIPLG